MVAPTPSLNWSSQLSVTASTGTPVSLTGDKILLPQSALEQLLAASASAPQPPPAVVDLESWDTPQVPQQRNQQLPHPLIFRLYNPANNRFSHAVPREFSAAEGEVGISPFLREALGLEEKDEEALREGETGSRREKPRITIVSKSLPKGTHVRLRPLEAGYDDEDWKALLERHLRMHFTTLTTGEILSVAGRTNSRGKGGRGEFRFLIDKLEPEEAVCIVDTGRHRTFVRRASKRNIETANSS
ncbi:hypothetical protein P167DRAFT_291476 [Morchella conica CCBAS932]|uniref:Ubiquitin fusion degradation protein UFD1 N-terminal subdomain 2 domain-containing protein n=1 Tax=Morchella conica CCBAS932 TaxID=1392247 RepID=A0A3N4KGK3_9PEZI|nr:hypothetical protein P167DRAFT_291476 [Morchella conica CCBAS932]